MERLSPAETRELAALAAGLDILRPGEEALSQRVMSALEVVGVRYPNAYGLEAVPTLRLGDYVGSNFDVGLMRRQHQVNWNHFLHSIALYDPLHVQRNQRNRVLLGARSLMSEEAWARACAIWRHAMPAMVDQLRVLVCDGPAMLAWVGGYGSEDFNRRHQARLQLLVPSLRRRLLHERRLREAGLVHAALEATMEALPGPALLLDGKFRPVHANRAARGLPLDLPSLELTPVEARGVPRHFLARRRHPRGALALTSTTVAQRYGLTPQELRVLEHVVQGRTNRAIAVELSCSERTVEIHVSRLLEKTGSDSRSVLVATVWREATA